jgi:DNA-binding PadR family transcriptional regulator
MATKRELTTPDLVLLGLLSEQPMHGYQANLELERRQIRDWAAISRPQVYYSLEKLANQGLVAAHKDAAAAEGPDRQVYATTRKGLTALERALETEHWTTTRERPPFLTWLALSWRVSAVAFNKQIARRRDFLEHELAREQATLMDVLKEVGHTHHEAVWMITLAIQQFMVEIAWLRKIAKEAPRRARAEHPDLVPATGARK